MATTLGKITAENLERAQIVMMHDEHVGQHQMCQDTWEIEMGKDPFSRS